MLWKLPYPKYLWKILIYAILALTMIFVMPLFFRYGNKIFGLWLLIITLILIQLLYIWRVYSTRYLLLNQGKLRLTAGWSKKTLWQKEIAEISQIAPNGSDLAIIFQNGQFVIRNVKNATKIASKINKSLQTASKM